MTISQHDTYTALVYHTQRGDYYAEAPAFPGLAGSGDTPQAALDGLAAEVRAALMEGEQPNRANEQDILITSVTLPGNTGNTRTYTAILIHEGESVTITAPALGIATQGTDREDALAMLSDAATLLLEDAPERANVPGEVPVSIVQLPLPATELVG